MNVAWDATSCLAIHVMLKLGQHAGMHTEVLTGYLVLPGRGTLGWRYLMDSKLHLGDTEVKQLM